MTQPDDGGRKLPPGFDAQIRMDVTHWIAEGRPSAMLYRGDDLDLAKLWARQHILDEHEWEFVELSSHQWYLSALVEFAQFIRTELLTRLTSIRAYAEMLQNKRDKYSERQIEQFSATMLRNAQRAIDLAHYLPTYTRMRAGLLAIDSAEYELVEFKEQLTRVFEPPLRTSSGNPIEVRSNDISEIVDIEVEAWWVDRLGQLLLLNWFWFPIETIELLFKQDDEAGLLYTYINLYYQLTFKPYYIDSWAVQQLEEIVALKHGTIKIPEREETTIDTITITLPI
ncbi:MAG: hypothetical protein GYB68_18690 [Chloroflexi bacterium]|nr:hypothetical protein [Chloroflexota bacterium]